MGGIVRSLLQNNSEMFDAHGHRRKLVIFTEHRDTLNYLAERIRSLLGKPEAVVTIHGGMGREERRKAQEAFMQDKEVRNPGRHRCRRRRHQSPACPPDGQLRPAVESQPSGAAFRPHPPHRPDGSLPLWNLVAKETREGEVYLRLLEKLDEEREALGGQVFDVLGKVKFEDRPLRELLMEAIRYGDQPEVRARLHAGGGKCAGPRAAAEADRGPGPGQDAMESPVSGAIREEMERAEARRLQPHFIASFFLEAFQLLGGTIREREPERTRSRMCRPSFATVTGPSAVASLC